MWCSAAKAHLCLINALHIVKLCFGLQLGLHVWVVHEDALAHTTIVQQGANTCITRQPQSLTVALCCQS